MQRLALEPRALSRANEEGADSYGWGRTELLIADVVDAINAITVGLGGKKSKFKRYPVPSAFTPKEEEHGTVVAAPQTAAAAMAAVRALFA